MRTYDTSSTLVQSVPSPEVVRSTVLLLIQERAGSRDPGFIGEHGEPNSGGGGKLARASLVMAADEFGLRPGDVRSNADELPRGRPAPRRAEVAGAFTEALGLVHAGEARELTVRLEAGAARHMGLGKPVRGGIERRNQTFPVLAALSAERLSHHRSRTEGRL